ncbi:MAG: glycoside hydrolase family 3 N-terminal domain-containing protein [Rikenellaceae bacterium]
MNTKLLLASLCCLTSLNLSAQTALDNQDQSFEQRARELILEMTLEEKISQMSHEAEAIPRLDVPQYNWWSECLHGLARSGKATVFPQSIGLAATFDDDLIFRMASAISDEARAFYNNASKRGNRGIYTGLTFYSPNVNIYRDPRWGRGQETYGEDPYLTSRMGVAFVEGLQGDDPKYLKAAACAKHYAVHSGPEKYRHQFNAEASVRDLNETYLPAFKALVQEANVRSVMGAYNRTNGEVCCASPTLLVDILKQRWGFEGYLTTDCWALKDFYDGHNVCKTAEEAAAMAVNHGMNLNCGSVYGAALYNAINMGLVSEEQIDELLFPLMLTRFELGLFDDEASVPFSHIDVDVVDSQKHLDLAYEAAVKSIVLLENKNNILPLSDDLNYIYLTGPNANNADALIGNYFGVSDHFTTFLEGFVSRVAPGVSVQYKQGVMIDKANTNPIDWASGEGSAADVVVACMGLTWLIEGEEGEAIASAQGGDMYDNSLPEAQMEYLCKLRKVADKANKPLVVVVTGGCPVQLTEIRELSDALLFAWYPGQAGGYALADIILGNANPSARTPITFVESLEHLPAFEDYSMEGRTYKYMREHKPLYPFGYGLSYSTFDYNDLQLSQTIKAGETQRVTIRVTNSSDRDGDEVVQLYITDLKASVAVPVRQLSDTKRVSLKAGESKMVELEISPEKMSLITDNNLRRIESGEFSISVGGGQPLAQTASFVEATFTVKGNQYLEL